MFYVLLPFIAKMFLLSHEVGFKQIEKGQVCRTATKVLFRIYKSHGIRNESHDHYFNRIIFYFIDIYLQNSTIFEKNQ